MPVPGNYTAAQERALRAAAEAGRKTGTSPTFYYLPGVCVWCKSAFDITAAKQAGGTDWACSERCADLTLIEVMAG